MANHQNNFATNLTSNQIAGVTTTPLNSIPSVAAPFYIALDATNLNGKYEVVSVTSKTATHINHAATTYAHTTAEEVRMVVPAEELDSFVTNAGTAGVISINTPQGFLINGKIVPSVNSNNLTVALKTLAGTDPSATDPVYCRIGDTVRTISAALSHTMNAGTNWNNAGSTELATKEIDWFTFLGWSTVDSAVHIGISRWPTDGTVPTAGSTNEKGCNVNGSMNSGDVVEVVGRFAATLSAGAGYTWSVPTYTTINLIQRPIYETRWLTCVPIITGGTAPTYTAQFLNRYKITGDILQGTYSWSNTSGGTAGSGANNINITLPFGISATASGTAASRYTIGTGFVYESTGTLAGFWANINGTTANQVYIFKSDLTSLQANDQSSTDRALVMDFRYEI